MWATWRYRYAALYAAPRHFVFVFVVLLAPRPRLALAFACVARTALLAYAGRTGLATLCYISRRVHSLVLVRTAVHRSSTYADRATRRRDRSTVHGPSPSSEVLTRPFTLVTAVQSLSQRISQPPHTSHTPPSRVGRGVAVSTSKRGAMLLCYIYALEARS
jgi:hypothetical protein